MYKAIAKRVLMIERDALSGLIKKLDDNFIKGS